MVPAGDGHMNALIESDRVQLLPGEAEVIATPSESGKGQRISRCPKCHVALWSNYGGGADLVRFVRIRTLGLAMAPVPRIYRAWNAV